MKKLLFLFALALCASVVRGQSTYPIRADSTVLYKQGGFNELVVRNRTKDSIGGVLYNIGNGVTAYKRSRAISANSFTVGGDTITVAGGAGGGEDLQQTLLIGNNTREMIVWDSLTPPPAANTGVSYHYMRINPMDTTHNAQPYFEGISANAGNSGTLGVYSNNVHYKGWNVTATGSVNVVGEPMIAEGMEQRWRPDPANVPYVGIDYTEWHWVYAGPSGVMHRIASYTMDNATESVQFYQTIDNLSLKRSIDDSVWFGQTIGGFQYERFGDHATWTMTGDASGVQLSHTGGSAIGDVLTMSGFGSAFLPYSLTLSDIDNHHPGSAILLTDSIGSLVTFAADRASGGASFTTPTSSGLGFQFNPNNITTVYLHTDYTAFSAPVIYDDNPSVGAPSQRVYIKTNGSYAVAERIDNNSAGSNTYNLQLVSTGTATQNELLYLLGINNAGASGNILIHTTTNTLVGATNYVVYSESPAQSVWAGYSRFGDGGLSNPRESGDFHGKVAIDSLDTDGGGNALVTYDNSTNRLEKRLSPEGSATLDFGSTSGGASTDLTINVTGAVSGDVVWLGVPNGSMPAGGSFFAWVSAADTVTVRFANNSSGSLDPSSGTFKVKVLK